MANFIIVNSVQYVCDDIQEEIRECKSVCDLDCLVFNFSFICSCMAKVFASGATIYV